jgi:hypothetical protein
MAGVENTRVRRLQRASEPDADLGHVVGEVGRLEHAESAHIEPGIVERAAEQELASVELELLAIRVVRAVEA